MTQQAYVEGVNTRRADNLLQALGLTGIDKSRVFRICKELDEVVETFAASRWSTSVLMSDWTRST